MSMMCLSKAQDDDSMAMCLSNSQIVGMKNVDTAAVDNSPPFWNEPPFRTLSQNFNLNLPLPNEDFGTNDKRGNPDFRSTFQWFVAQIEYSRP